MHMQSRYRNAQLMYSPKRKKLQLQIRNRLVDQLIFQRLKSQKYNWYLRETLTPSPVAEVASPIKQQFFNVTIPRIHQIPTRTLRQSNVTFSKVKSPLNVKSTLSSSSHRITAFLDASRNDSLFSLLPIALM